MTKKNLSFDQLIDLFIRARAAMFDDRISEPSSELGLEDDWLYEEVDNYIDKLSSEEFIALIKKIVEISKEKYQYPSLVVFGVAREMIMRRPTLYHLQKYPDKSVPLVLSNDEEKLLVDYLLTLKDSIPDSHKYEVYALIEELTGKWLGKKDRYLP